MDLYLEGWDAGLREAWIGGLQSLADAIGAATLVTLLALLAMAVLLTPRRQRRRVVCPLSGRARQVQWEACGVPRVLWAATVRSCSAFDPPTAVACDGACLRGCAGRGTGVRGGTAPAAGMLA